ncbi:MAG TPA: MFS transporter [Thermoleophilaceae bacterium]
MLYWTGMGWVSQLLREEPRARRFFFAYFQSTLGTGAAYVAILLVAYERLHSAWGISLVLLAEIAPPIALGPLFGAAVDRWSRRAAAITADCVRCAAFIGIAFTHSFILTFVLALMAGAGTALSKPAIMASLPSVLSPTRLAQGTALYGALTEIGLTAGPGLAAIVLLFGGPDVLLAANAATFGISAAVLSTIRFGAVDAKASARGSLLGQAREGIGVALRDRVIRTVVGATSSILFFGGLINVAELLFARELGAGRTGYALLVTLSGVGIATGSLMGKEGGPLGYLERRFLAGLGLVALGCIAASASPIFAGVAVAVTLCGIGNGMVIVFQRLILQRSVDESLLGRVFGVQVASDGIAFTSSYLLAGGLLTLVGPRTMFIVAAAGGSLVVAATARGLRARWKAGEPPADSSAPAEVPEELAVVGGPELG